ncbi:PrgI family protein [Candidatus Daviesbacteria bacterium]|nr:PrgI family protein [Candidatus Daviesbacteria bacterium]
MEAHPIPQNVTSFQFKLVGDMTLKQFVYLASGVGMAYLIFVLFAANLPFISWPFIILFTLLGVAFAFLPIESRPLDHWLAAFLTAIYSPTKRIWKKNGKNYKEDALYASRLVTYLSGPAKEAPLAIKTAETAPQTADISKLPTKEELQKTVDLARQAQQLQMKIIQTERALSQIKDQAQKPTPVPIDYGQEVNKILTDLQSLVSQASVIKEQIQSIQKPQTGGANVTPPPFPKEKVKVVIPIKPKQTTVALTTFPNVLNGIVKDAQNNYLESVVAVIYNKDGLPVRALKTNKLGQFTGSTPLPNGTYNLELEKDNFSFDVLQIELSGTVLPPLMITAKT